jgi:hypothetical protein
MPAEATHRGTEGTEKKRSLSRCLTVSVCRISVIVAAVCVVASAAYTQGRRGPSGVRQVTPYDSRLVFTRIAYNTGLAGFGFNSNAWNHDYPAADRNVAALIDYISHARVRLDGTNVLELGDPEIFRNPVLYIWEPGFWTITKSEAENLRKYLLKGGFVIFDDFEEQDQWDNMAAQVRQAMPELDWIRIDVEHPIFHSFYDIKKLDVPHPIVNVIPEYYALFENNDANGRMLALANHNNDIAEYWEWSAEGLYATDWTGDAYRLGVNFFIYALTH